jgi:hypothetical protein
MRRDTIAAAAVLVALLPTASTGQSNHARTVHPDFSAVTSIAAAKALAARGKLVRIYLFPTELGGPDVDENITYVPPEAAAALSLVTGTLQRYVKQGLVDKMDVTPDYKGKSIVPSRIVMNATHSKKPGAFHPTVEIW